MAILSVKDLHTHFFTRQGVVKAVNGVSFDLEPMTTLGIMGESGAGKTVTALSILRLVPYPGRIVAGEVYFEGKDLMRLDKEELRQIRGRHIAMIFQDATTSLDSIMSIGEQVTEKITSHLPVSKREARRLSIGVLRQAGLPDPERVFSQYPFQLSGGMCQRVMIAIAMALDPEVLIADEPTSAIDVTIQAEILAEIKKLRDIRHSSIILISHDLGVIAGTADVVAVMYGGSIVEYGSVLDIFNAPAHPYTVALLQSLPRMDRADGALMTMRGSPPSLLNLSDECTFLGRCSKARNECRYEPSPELKAIAPDHLVACYNPVIHGT